MNQNTGVQFSSSNTTIVSSNHRHIHNSDSNHKQYKDAISTENSKNSTRVVNGHSEYGSNSKNNQMHINGESVYSSAKKQKIENISQQIGIDNIHLQENKQNDTSLRLFTFMDSKQSITQQISSQLSTIKKYEQQIIQKYGKSIKTLEQKNIPSKNNNKSTDLAVCGLLNYESFKNKQNNINTVQSARASQMPSNSILNKGSNLKTMIDQSRRKRQDFLNQMVTYSAYNPAFSSCTHKNSINANKNMFKGNKKNITEDKNIMKNTKSIKSIKVQDRYSQTPNNDQHGRCISPRPSTVTSSSNMNKKLFRAQSVLSTKNTNDNKIQKQILNKQSNKIMKKSKSKSKSKINCRLQQKQKITGNRSLLKNNQNHSINKQNHRESPSASSSSLLLMKKQQLQQQLLEINEQLLFKKRVTNFGKKKKRQKDKKK